VKACSLIEAPQICDYESNLRNNSTPELSKMDRLMSAMLFALIVCAASGGMPAAAGRVLRGTASGSRSLQQLQYVPQGCQGLVVAVTSATTGYDVFQNPVVTGEVQLSNPNTFDMPIGSIKVQLSNNIPVAPLFTTAECQSSVVPANPQPYQMGTATCTFTFSIPTNGIAAGFSHWPSVMATAVIGMSNAQCPSAVFPVASSPPLVYSTATNNP